MTLISAMPKTSKMPTSFPRSSGKNRGSGETSWFPLRGRKGHCGVHEAVVLVVFLWLALDSGWLSADNLVVIPIVVAALYYLMRAL